MASQQLLDYIKQQLDDGVSKEEIKSTLINSGWAGEDVAEAFSNIASALDTAVPVPMAPKPAIAYSSVSEDSPSAEVMQTETSPAVFAGVGELFSHSWNIYKSRFWVFLGIGSIQFIFVVVFLYSISSGYSESLNLSKLTTTIIIFLSGLLIVVVASWSQVSLLYAIKDSAEGIGIVESFRRGWKKLLFYWWIIILLTAIFIGGMILFVIPAYLFMVWFFIAPFVLVSEDIKGMSALMKSKEYIRGRWWGVFGRILSILVSVLIIFVIIGTVLTFMGFSKDSITYNLVTQITNLLVLPFILVYCFSLYRSLKEARGEFVFDPKKGRGKFIAFGILGAVIIPLMILFSLVLASLNIAKHRGQDAVREVNTLKTEIDAYSKRKGTLPQSLNDLVAPGQNDGKIRDDVTNKLYEYSVGQDGRYSLCTSQRGDKKYCVGDMKGAKKVLPLN